MPSSIRVTKTHFSSSSRVLFVAGLEGSGHHMWQQVLGRCFRRGLCETDANLSTLLHAVRHRDGPHGQLAKKGLFEHALQDGAFVYESPPAETEARLARVRERLHAAASSSKPRLLVLNGIGGGLGMCVPLHGKDNGTRGTTTWCSGMLSYPNMAGLNRALHNPDLYRLARWAEAAGADLRVVVVRRSALATLLSTSSNRHRRATALKQYGSWASQVAANPTGPRTLWVTTALLAARILLDGRFFRWRCASYESFGADAAPFLPWIHPKLEIASVQASRRSNQPLHPHEAELAERLQAAIDALGGECRRAHERQ